jgi:hypothetical protein
MNTLYVYDIKERSDKRKQVYEASLLARMRAE